MGRNRPYRSRADARRGAPRCRARLPATRSHCRRVPPPPWWRHVAESGGQAVEQATHLYDAARFLVGEAEVHGAASAHSPRADHPDADVDSVAAAVLRFETGAIGAFVNTSVLDSDVIE